MKIELFGEAKSLADVPSGDIFSTILSNGRLARFIKVTGSDTNEGVYLGSIAVGPYLEDDRPVQFYTPDVVAPDEFVLHETEIKLVPVRSSEPDLVLDKNPTGQPLGSVIVTTGNRALLRFRSHRKTGFVGLEDGRLTNVSASDIVARYAHYCLVGPNESGRIVTLFDSTRPE